MQRLGTGVEAGSSTAHEHELAGFVRDREKQIRWIDSVVAPPFPRVPNTGQQDPWTGSFGCPTSLLQ